MELGFDAAFSFKSLAAGRSIPKIIQNSNFKKRINLAEQKAQLDDRLRGGRQIAFMIYEYLSDRIE